MTELLVILVAMSVGAFVKGVTGTGLPQVAIPTMAIFLGVEHAVVVMAIPGVVTNAWMLWTHREHWHATRDVPVMVAGGAVGALVGTFGLKVLDPRWLSLALGGVIVLYLVMRLVNNGFAIPAGLARYVAPPVGLVAGLLQGSTGISGPMLTMYLHGLRLARQVFIVSIVTLFLVFAVVQTGTLVALGMFDADRLRQGVLALVPIMLVLWAAARYAHRMREDVFDRWVLVLLAVFAVALIYDGVTG
ncbi:sulfite exporter TauE/SafE family protein [Phytoactinopolyspora limicola]|uniref:sulfite exporter TauE/SafE family protein n=1 Tax=Phytoactinopolyspora limicola TaxID=2715536 RepID=UPI00140D25F9|nr:sulfite exporter TauE/SafE family protein [Phytoactinopolyspora limicola]